MDRNESFSTATTYDSKHADDQLEYAGQHGQHIGITKNAVTHPAHANATEKNAYAQHARISRAGQDTHGDKDIVDWDGPDDPENPFNWSTRYKWMVTLTTCFISILTGLPAGAYGTAGAEMARIWNVSEDRFLFISFGLVTWNMGAAIFPLVFVPLTETVGRMLGYFVSYIFFLIWLLPSALSQNFVTIIITRFFAGGASSVAINVVGGTITELWKGDKARSLPMSIFALSGVIGIALGPFIGGVTTSGLDWRWIYWIQIIIDAALLPVFCLILKETRSDVILARRAAKMRKEGRSDSYAESELENVSLLQNIKISCLRPTKMLATEFIVTTFTL